jgi:hypothetical protein
MFSFIRRRKYRAAAISDIKRLLEVMPEEFFTIAKQMRGIEEAFKLSFERETPPAECAINCVAIMMGMVIQRLDQSTRDNMLWQYENPGLEPFGLGLHVMLSNAMKLTTNLATIDGLGVEIFGALHGLSRNEKDAWLEQLAEDKVFGRRDRLPPWAS